MIISVVTPSYNQGEFIEETIRSVISQAGTFHLDYVVVDGGSSDQTLTILHKYERMITERVWPIKCSGIDFRWVSEKDEGQADAINKGVKLSRGDVCGWLNSDDIFFPKALNYVCSYFEQNPGTKLLYGNAKHIDREGTVIDAYPVENFNLDRLAAVCFICQPAAFFRKAAFYSIGGVNAGLRTCMDYDLWIRFGRNFVGGIRRVEFLFAGSRMYPENKTLSLRELVYEESIATVKKHYGFVPESWIYLYDIEIIGNLYLKNFSNPHFSFLLLPLKIYYRVRFFFRFCNMKTLQEALKIRKAKRRSIGKSGFEQH